MAKKEKGEKTHTHTKKTELRTDLGLLRKQKHYIIIDLLSPKPLFAPVYSVTFSCITQVISTHLHLMSGHRQTHTDRQLRGKSNPFHDRTK